MDAASDFPAMPLCLRHILSTYTSQLYLYFITFFNFRSGDHAGHRHAEHGHGEAKMEDLVTGKFPLDHEFILEAAEEKEALLSPVYTFFAFVFTCCSLPFVFSVYFGKSSHLKLCEFKVSVHSKKRKREQI